MDNFYAVAVTDHAVGKQANCFSNTKWSNVPTGQNKICSNCNLKQII